MEKPLIPTFFRSWLFRCFVTHDLKIDFLDAILSTNEVGDVEETSVKEENVVDQGKFPSIFYLIYSLNVEPIILRQFLATADPLAV